MVIERQTDILKEKRRKEENLRVQKWGDTCLKR